SRCAAKMSENFDPSTIQTCDDIYDVPTWLWNKIDPLLIRKFIEEDHCDPPPVGQAQHGSGNKFSGGLGGSVTPTGQCPPDETCPSSFKRDYNDNHNASSGGVSSNGGQGTCQTGSLNINIPGGAVSIQLPCGIHIDIPWPP